jgi:anaerobic carbon-monoxide dehydrogenase iron sulfur subunit
MKRVYSKEEVCMACGLCQVHCLVAHSESKDIIKAYKKESPRQSSRIKVQQKGSLSFPLSCRHCEEPWCVYSCLTGALQKDPESGIVTVDAEKCVGCFTCVVACPCSAIIPDFHRKKAVKCDLCPHLETPACVANCPNYALIYTDGAAAAIEARTAEAAGAKR